jgi:hypothetical protein
VHGASNGVPLGVVVKAPHVTRTDLVGG